MLRFVRSSVLALCLMPSVVAAQSAAVQAAATQPAVAESRPAVTAEALAKAELDGKLAAEGASGWFGRGIAVGAIAGPLGILIGYAVAANSTPELPAEKKVLIADQPAEVQAAYQRGYTVEVRKHRKSTINKGGWTGFGGWVLLLLASGSSAQ